MQFERQRSLTQTRIRPFLCFIIYNKFLISNLQTNKYIQQKHQVIHGYMSFQTNIATSDKRFRVPYNRRARCVVLQRDTCRCNIILHGTSEMDMTDVIEFVGPDSLVCLIILRQFYFFLILLSRECASVSTRGRFPPFRLSGRRERCAPRHVVTPYG